MLIAGHEKGQSWVRLLHSARLTGNLLTLGQIRHATIKTNDYYPLIARAVERLDRSTGEARRAVYERARKAVAELRSNQLALLDAEITEERLALEEAIRKVEAEAARKSPTEARTEPQSAPLPDGDNIQSRDHGQPASPDRDDRPPALPSRQAPIFLPTASDDRNNTDIQAVAIGGAYGADHYYDDVPDLRWRGGLLAVMAVLALAVLAVTFVYRAMSGGYVFPALPPIVKAGTGPDNIVRNNSDTRRSNSSRTSITSAGSSEKLQPMDIREAPKAVPRVISTIPISSKPSAAAITPLAPAPAATAPALDPPVASALDQHVAPSVPPPASAPVPVSASSEPKETAAVAPIAREPSAPSPALAPPLLTAASVPPPASAPVPVPASSEHAGDELAACRRLHASRPPLTPYQTLLTTGAPAPSPALAPPLLTTASVPPPASGPLPVPASSEETAAVAPVAREPGAPSPALAPPLFTAASVPPPGLGSGASAGFLGAAGDSGGCAGCTRAGCAFAGSCPAAAHDSICPAARLGSAASTGFLGDCGGRACCTRAGCAFARSCPAATHGSICPAARLGSLGADGGSQGHHRRPTWVGGNGYTLAARAR